MKTLGGAQPRMACLCTATCHIRICYNQSQEILNFGLHVLHLKLSYKQKDLIDRLQTLKLPKSFI